MTTIEADATTREAGSTTSRSLQLDSLRERWDGVPLRARLVGILVILLTSSYGRELKVAAKI